MEGESDRVLGVGGGEPACREGIPPNATHSPPRDTTFQRLSLQGRQSDNRLSALE